MNTPALWSAEWAARWPLAWVLQALAHALVAQFLVESAIVTFAVRRPVDQFRLRLAVLFAPLVLPPLAQLADPARGSFYFRLDTALLDLARLADLTVNGAPFGQLLLLLTVLGTVVLLVRQELWPVLRQRLASAEPPQRLPPPPELLATFRTLATGAGLPEIPLGVVETDSPLLFTTQRPTPSVVVSTGLLARLDPEALTGALAHELAHILRRSSSVSTALYGVRLATFFSPVTLLVFRRLVLDEEHVCDDVATKLVGSPEPLARALELLAGDGSSSGAAPGALEDRAHFLQLRERIARLRRDVEAPACGPAAYLAVALSLALFGYLVV